TASLADANLPKGLFTKELESALISEKADLAVHSLKDLPTEIPKGLKLGAVLEREDVRDVLICRRDASYARANMGIRDLPKGATVATSSTRRAAQVREIRSDLKIVPIRGNVPTRLRKLAQQQEIDALILAAAGLSRLQIEPAHDGLLTGPEEVTTPELCGALIPLDEMLPCVGQAAIGVEICATDRQAARICAALNHTETLECVTAERAFLRAMGGGCQLAVAAYAQVRKGRLHMHGVSFLKGAARRAEVEEPDPARLGLELARKLS
ncbi:MAG TPA: hydroxymethylbilane synthase, partial [Candidatus Binatia bacterium]|nr:hydroxymethylbilane synthase [Candidatus Binatia bacterium]